METKDLYFDLPDELIAQYPADRRGNDRLLTVNRKTGEYKDMRFSDFPNLLEPGCLLVLNESKVRKARVFASTENGGKVELLFLSPESGGAWRVTSNRLKKRKVGETFLAGKVTFKLLRINDDGTFCIAPVSGTPSPDGIREDFFLENGHVPLPPYIKREDEFSDESRYQTVYAKNLGSVASPTAGLHYTKEILDSIRARGVKIAFVTLHVGMGTFLPIRSQTLEDHRMHSEDYEITQENANLINSAMADKTPIIASGTTSLRCLESAFDASSGKVRSGFSSTSIFITPGYDFKVVNRLLTNFHTPYSTLMALVAAFSSLDIVKNAYEHAVREKYRFFSYGDATYWY